MIYVAVLQVSLFRIDLSSVARVAYELDNRGLESQQGQDIFLFFKKSIPYLERPSLKHN